MTSPLARTGGWREEIRNGRRMKICELAEVGFIIEDDGSTSGLFLAVAYPFGGVAGGIDPIERGPQGFAPSIDEVNSTFIELEDDDPTPGFLKFTETAPPTPTSGPLWAFTGALHRGAQGPPGTGATVPGDYVEDPEDIVAGQMLAVASDLESFELVYPKVGAEFWPAAITSKSDGSATSGTLAQVNIPAQLFDWRPDVSGYCIVEGSGTNFVVDLNARLDAADGPRVGRCQGLGGVTKDRLVLASGPDTAAADGVTKIAAGQSATIYFTVDKMSGASNYTVSNSTARFSVKVFPVQ